MKMGRVPASSRANVDLLKQLFYEEDLASHGVLVLTHWDGELGDEAQDLRTWEGSDEEIHSITRSFSKIVLTNNQLKGRGTYPESRQECLRQLTASISENLQPVQSRPVNAVDVLNYLLKKYLSFLWKNPLTTGLAYLTQDGESVLPTFCGECSICMQSISLVEVCK